MKRFERSTRISAPLSAVWEFHSDTDGLVALTPGWMNLEIESVRGPDGEPDPPILEAGAVIDASVRPFGKGPRQRWVSEITEREQTEGTAYFTDVMAEGPFPEWEHTHLFYADGDETILRDRVEFELPFGPLGKLGEPFAPLGFEPFFRFRHRRTRSLLE